MEDPQKIPNILLRPVLGVLGDCISLQSEDLLQLLPSFSAFIIDCFSMYDNTNRSSYGGYDDVIIENTCYIISQVAMAILDTNSQCAEEDSLHVNTLYNLLQSISHAIAQVLCRYIYSIV